MKQQKNLLTKTLYVIASDRQKPTYQTPIKNNTDQYIQPKVSSKIIPITKLIRRLCI